MELTLPIAFLAAFAALVAAAAGAAIALAWAMARAAQRPQEGLAAALARLETERAKDRLEQVKFIEEALEVGETLKRHRARIDGAEGAARKKAAKEEELQPPQPITREAQLEAVKNRARAMGRL